MIQLAIAAMTALQVSTLTLQPKTATSVAPTTVTSRVTSAPESTVTSPEHIARARTALQNGDFDIARREFVMAAAIDRDEGKLPTEASFGLAHVLYAQSFNREAAIVMDRLAAEASRVGDIETESAALLDALWLNLDAKQHIQARADASRLRALAKERTLSAEMKQRIAQRVR